jgi:hypothetical protein
MMNTLILIVATVILGASAQPGTVQICWRDSYAIGVGTIPKGCDPDHELNGALCYQDCHADYYGVGPVCWETCKPNMTDGGVFCYGDGQSEYTKKSYGRGVGTIPKCADGYTEYLALCYKNCDSGWTDVGPVCWHNGSGNPNYTEPCRLDITGKLNITAHRLGWLNVTVAYGKTPGDCTELRSNLGYLEQGSAACISWAIKCITEGKWISPSGDCQQDIIYVVQKLYQTRLCQIITTTSGPTTTAGSTSAPTTITTTSQTSV